VSARAPRPRLLPALILALGALGVLKLAGLATLGGFVLLPVSEAAAQNMSGNATLDPPGQLRQERLDLAQPKQGGGSEAATAESDGRHIDLDAAAHAPSPAELDLLESLRQRREDLDKRAEELSMRENLLTAAQKRIEQKITELKDIKTEISKRIEERKAEDGAQIDDLVSMYSNMKSKDAAKIFERLDFNVLVGVARRLKPRVLAPILASMDPDVAGALTVKLADLAPSAEARSDAPGQELAPVVGQ